MTKKYQQQLIAKIQKQAADIRDKKALDYANKDVLSNFKVAGELSSLSAEQNCLSLIATKVARLGNLIKEDKTIQNEPIKDSVLDLINYGYLLYCLLDEKENQNKVKQIKEFKKWQDK